MRACSLRRAAAVTALVLGTAGCGDEADDAAESARRTATTLADRVEGATRLTATLTGASEVPGPGDPDGAGTATVNLDVSKTEVCYEVAVQRIDKPVGMHIHEGETGKAGAVVVALTTPASGDTTTRDCANADAALIGRMAANPGNFYVNVHTGPHPQGAVRGQLSQ
jgi:hypothetical protein